MLTSLRLLHAPFWRRHPLGALLPVVGVALGVATVLAIDVAGASAVRSFRETIEKLDGRTSHRVVGPSLPPDLSRRLARLSGVEAAAPVAEALALHVPAVAPIGAAGRDARPPAPGEALRLLGIDPLAEGTIRSLGVDESRGREGARAKTRDVGSFREFVGRPGALLVSDAFLRRHELRPGDPLRLVVGAVVGDAYVLGALPEQVGGLEVPDNLAVGDIATVQELSRNFVLTRIDLVLSERERERVLAAVARDLPPGARVVRPGGEARRLERGIAAFRANIQALSYLALFVSFFLIYNSVLLAVLRRRPLLGIARCLGATRRQVLSAWVAEACITGAAGALLGVALGVLLSEPALREVARTSHDLYGGTSRADVTVDAAALLKAAGLGLAFAFLAALLPALEAASTPPARTSARSGVERGLRGRRRAARVTSALLALSAMVALAWRTASPVPGYVAAAALALAVALLVPDVMQVALRPRRRSRVGGSAAPILRLAAANIRANLSRTGVAVAALMVALSMSVAMATLVRSYREDLLAWIAQSVRADVYVSPLGVEADRERARLPDGLAADLAALPEVEAVDTYRTSAARVGELDVVLAAVDVPVLRSRVRWPLLDGTSQEPFFDALTRGSAGVSEALARKSGLARRDTVDLVLAGERHRLPIAGVYRDYGTDRGEVLVDRKAFSRRHDLGPPRSVALYLRPGADRRALTEQLQSTVGTELALLVRGNRDLRERTLTVFDRTFAITRAMEAIGLVVAAIGILSALLAMLLERSRELATLRALGLTRAQLAGLFLGESTILALLAWILAVVTGGALAWILLAVINVRSFGWALDYSVPWSALGATLLASLVAAWAATLWPLARLAALRIAPLLREE